MVEILDKSYQRMSLRTTHPVMISTFIQKNMFRVHVYRSHLRRARSLRRKPTTSILTSEAGQEEGSTVEEGHLTMSKVREIMMREVAEVAVVRDSQEIVIRKKTSIKIGPRLLELTKTEKKSKHQSQKMIHGLSLPNQINPKTTRDAKSKKVVSAKTKNFSKREERQISVAICRPKSFWTRTKLKNTKP